MLGWRGTHTLWIWSTIYKTSPHSVSGKESGTVSQERFQPMTSPTQDFIFLIILSRPYIWSNMLFHVSWKIFCPRRYSFFHDYVYVNHLIVCFFFAVRMCLQIARLRGCNVLLVDFVQLFSAVRFQMSPQSSCQRGGIVALVAFIWPFSTVRFQMCPQIACLRRCIITLVAFVWLFSTVHF